MNIIAIIKNNFLMLVDVATVIGFSAFKAVEKKAQSNLIFKYEAPPGTDPFAEAKVKNTANWVLDETSTPCPTTQNQVACSISVPPTNTMNSGQELDPTKVSIASQQFTSNNHRVINGTGYSSPVNRSIP